MPIRVGMIGLGALDLFRSVAGPLSVAQLTSAEMVADAAAQILLDLVDESSPEMGRGDSIAQWAEVASLSRVEVYQATGMLMAQLDLSAAAALVRLRAYAFANELTASEVAQLVKFCHLRMEN